MNKLEWATCLMYLLGSVSFLVGTILHMVERLTK